MFLGTLADNMADKVAKGRQARGEGYGFARLTEADVREIRKVVIGELQLCVEERARVLRGMSNNTSTCIWGKQATIKHKKLDERSHPALSRFKDNIQVPHILIKIDLLWPRRELYSPTVLILDIIEVRQPPPRVLQLLDGEFTRHEPRYPASRHG